MESLTLEQDLKVAWWYLFEPRKHKEYIIWLGKGMSNKLAFDNANNFKKETKKKSN
jgi:hypothetical protein